MSNYDNPQSTEIIFMFSESSLVSQSQPPPPSRPLSLPRPLSESYCREKGVVYAKMEKIPPGYDQNPQRGIGMCPEAILTYDTHLRPAFFIMRPVA